MKQYKRVLSIAGSDPSGGAGIQADIKTISALGCFATTAITAVVDENTVGVYGVYPIPTSFVQGQIKSVLNDIGTDAIKIGMLHSSELICAVAETLGQYQIDNIVLDPVMVATSGDELMQNDAVNVLKNILIPMSKIITPNIPEAETLLGHKIASKNDMKEAAFELSMGKVSVMLKSGHLDDDDTMTDIFYDVKTGCTSYLSGNRTETKNTHGTGCTLSSAIASYLALGCSPTDAVAAAKQYIDNAIAIGSQFDIGKGHGPVCHFWNSQNYK